MNVNGIIEALQRGITGPGQRLILAPDPEFASTLTLGQIIKGKVLRHYEGNRYAVNFGGQEKVVDSSVPLRNGEILYGRVIGLDDKVQLQRVYTGDPRATEHNKPAIPDTVAGLVATPAESRVLRLFEQYQARLNQADLRMLGQLVRSAAQPDLMAMSGLVLSKLGVTLEPVLVRALYRALHENNPAGADPSRTVAALAAGADGDSTGFGREAVEQLASALSNTPAQQRPETAGHDASAQFKAESGPAQGGGGRESFDEESRKQEWLLGRFLLNVQGEGAVSHRLATFPIWLGDRLVEVEMALFSQNGHRTEDGVEYRKLVFSLDTERLGHIEIGVYAADRNLRVIVSADNEAATSELARYLPDLKNDLTAFGWRLDELSYRTTEADLQGNVIRSVVEHHISRDSLSRLM